MLQKLFFKLFKRHITAKVEKLGQEEKTKFLLNELIIAIQKDGKSFADPNISDDFGSASIWIHCMGTPNSELVIEKVGKWRISTKPTFKLMEEK